MTLEDVRKYFKTSYQFHKKTKIAATSWIYWRKIGYIPIESQKKIQDLTNGELKLSWEHIK